MRDQFWLWVIFGFVVIGSLILDLRVFNRKSHAISIKEALLFSGFWIALALVFNGIILFWEGPDKALEFLTGYLLEKSLSVDNLFVFLLVFSYFRVPPAYQHKVLFWGILGALIMRFIFIFAGLAIIQKFYWVIYLFGIFLIMIGIKMTFQKSREVHPEKNIVLRMFKRFFPVTSEYSEDRFFLKVKNSYLATPLFVVLLVIETTDVVFAMDSIPAIFAITLDSFIVFTSNIFAILGLRALYFALAGIMQKFKYLNYGLSIILVFIGFKMLFSHVYKIPIVITFGVIFVVLLISVMLSIFIKDGGKKDKIIQ